MALGTRRPFVAGNDIFVARKNFTYDSVEYKSGDKFPWRELGVSETTLRKLYEANHIHYQVIEANVDEKGFPLQAAG